MNTITFESENRKGTIGEMRFIKYLEDNNIDYIDVRSNKKYQKQDIDFIIGEKGFEVKTDYNVGKTGNIALELSIEREGYLIDGWWFKTKADNLIVVDGRSNKSYRVRVELLRELIKYHNFRRTSFPIRDCGQVTISTLLLIPLNFFEDKEDIIWEFEA
jgi:hypothetical protein